MLGVDILSIPKAIATLDEETVLLSRLCEEIRLERHFPMRTVSSYPPPLGNAASHTTSKSIFLLARRPGFAREEESAQCPTLSLI